MDPTLEPSISGVGATTVDTVSTTSLSALLRERRDVVPEHEHAEESEQVHQENQQESGELIIERDALVAFYQRHDASKIDNVDFRWESR